MATGPLQDPPKARANGSVARSLKVLAGQRVADGLSRFAVLRVPVACAPVELLDAVGLLVQQARAKDIGKEVMVAIPLAAVVERDKEQVPSIEDLQHGLAAGLAGNGVAQRAGHPIQDGGLQQEAPDVFGLTLEDLLDEVIDDVAVVTRKARDTLIAPVSDHWESGMRYHYSYYIW